MSIKVRATFPGDDERLQPGGSQALWSKAHKLEIDEGGRVRLRWCVTVICGGCGEPRSVQVRRGLSDARELTVADLALGAGALGECALYCRGCWLKYFRRDLSLPDGSEVFFSRWGADGLPISCGECKTEQIAACDRAASYEGFTLPCPGCGHLVGEVEHASKAKLRWLDRKPVRLGQQSKVAFICAHCDGKHYVFPENAKRDDWRGRSDECKRVVNDKRLVEDKKSEVSGTWARFKTEKGGMVTIEYEKCPHRREIPHRQAVDTYKNLPSVCPGCRQNAIRDALRKLKDGELPTLTESQPRGSKKGRGRKQGDVLLPPDRVKADFVAIVQYLRKEKKMQPHKIKRPAIRDEYQRRGENISLTTVTNRARIAFGAGVEVEDAVALALAVKPAV